MLGELGTKEEELELGTSNEEQKNNNMGTITGTRTRNNKKMVKELGTKIKNIGHGFKVKGHSIRKRNKYWNIKHVIRKKLKN